MLRPRVIPILTLAGRQMVKTVAFERPKYLGDPVNAVRIFNTKEVDELVVLDITASTDGRPVDLDALRELAGECFMPLTYGGGVRTLHDAEAVLRCGVEKVVVDTAALDDPGVVAELAGAFGRQAVVVALDVRRGRLGGHRVVRTAGRHRPTGRAPSDWAAEVEALGAGELLLMSIDRDGTATGYDLPLVREVASRVGIPVVAAGGAGELAHVREVLAVGAAAAAAGRLFTTRGRHLASLVSYPSPEEIEGLAS